MGNGRGWGKAIGIIGKDGRGAIAARARLPA